MKHFGIDPRKPDNITNANAFTAQGNYNPYKNNSKPSKQSKITLPKNQSRASSQNSIQRNSNDTNINLIQLSRIFFNRI